MTCIEHPFMYGFMLLIVINYTERESMLLSRNSLLFTHPMHIHVQVLAHCPMMG